MLHKIFLDVQVNRDTDEILSIGALGCNKGFVPKEMFYALIRTNTDGKSSLVYKA